MHAASSGLQIPPIDDQTWWYKCFCSITTLKGHRRPITKDPHIEAAALSLFGPSADWTSGDNLWAFINELARDAKTACQNMIAGTFHVQLQKAYRREVLLWEHANQRTIAKETKFRIVNHYVRLVSGHQQQTHLTADDLPLDLGVQLEALTRTWQLQFASVLPCPHSSFIYNISGDNFPKLRTLLSWMHQLQVHRAACLQTLQSLLPPSSSTDAAQLLGKSGKAQGLLPIASYKTKCIAISATGLKCLLAAGRLDKTHDFAQCFPGIRRFLRGGRVESQQYIRTDGVSASIVLQDTLGSPVVKKRKVAKANDDDGTSRGVTPIEPSLTQRLVAIDPGRREMLTAVVQEQDVLTDSFSVSTKYFRREAGTARAANFTASLQRQTFCADGVSLAEKLESLPCRRNIYEWRSYLDALLPVLSQALAVRRTKSLLRASFRCYMLRDKALDTICKRITANQRGTLVAFGGANSCSTGFGHAPAPQGRLRWRLEKLHGAKISIVDEYNTSQRCCLCSSKLHHGTATHYRSDGSKYRMEIHHVLCCSHCLTDKGVRKYWHRDINAARNILACYLAEAQKLPRPEALRRPTKIAPAPLAM